MGQMDKGRQGQVPMTSFLKVLRIFGVGVNQSLVKGNEVGMVEYEKVLDQLAQAM